MRAPQDYIALTAIPGPNGVRAYNPGDDVPASAVENLGLVVGEQVRPARPDVIARPAGNASRADWAAYWSAQGLSADEIDGMTRDEMAEREPDFPDDEPIAPSNVALPGEPVGGVTVAKFVQPDNVAAQAAEQGVSPRTEPADEPERPASGARKAEWVEYAVASGMPREVAEDSTIDQLASHDYDLYKA